VWVLTRSVNSSATPFDFMAGSQKLRLCIIRVLDMASALFDIAMPLIEQTVHGTDRTQVFPLIKQGGIDLARGTIHEPLIMEKIEHLLSLRLTQRQGRRRSVTASIGDAAVILMPVKRGA
jgi:hypothetical protein